MRETSLIAWKRINEAGLVGPFQLEVLNIVVKHGPITAGEAWKHYKESHPATNRGRNEVAKRIYELCVFGVVADTGLVKECPVTKFQASLWEFTGNLPVKEKRKPREICPHCDGTGYVPTTIKKATGKRDDQMQLFGGTQ